MVQSQNGETVGGQRFHMLNTQNGVRRVIYFSTLSHIMGPCERKSAHFDPS